LRGCGVASSSSSSVVAAATAAATCFPAFFDDLIALAAPGVLLLVGVRDAPEEDCLEGVFSDIEAWWEEKGRKREYAATGETGWIEASLQDGMHN
jgi:hypothetical protein